jgi:hypothetical protein
VLDLRNAAARVRRTVGENLRANDGGSHQ